MTKAPMTNPTPVPTAERLAELAASFEVLSKSLGDAQFSSECADVVAALRALIAVRAWLADLNEYSERHQIDARYVSEAVRNELAAILESPPT